MDDIFLQSYWGSHTTHPEGPSTTLSNKERRMLSNEDRAIFKRVCRRRILFAYFYKMWEKFFKDVIPAVSPSSTGNLSMR